MQVFLTNKITFKVKEHLKNKTGGGGGGGMVSRFLTTIPSFHFALIGNLVDIDCLISITAPVYAQATKISTLNIGSTCHD